MATTTPKIRNWYYFDANSPHIKFFFNDGMNVKIDASYENYLSNNVNYAFNPSGTTFNFNHMEYKKDKEDFHYKLSYYNLAPYNAASSDGSNVLTGEDKAFLDKNKTQTVKRWFRWSKNVDLCRFANDDPMWTRYDSGTEKIIEELYQRDPNSSNPQQVDGTYCVLFRPAEKSNVMLQGRIDDENDYRKPAEQKRRRPITRVEFCWCYDSSADITKSATWVPYEPRMSELLEDALVRGEPEVSIKLGEEEEEEIYIVNFAQGIQFSASDSSKKVRIARYGSEIVGPATERLYWGYHTYDGVTPKDWLKGQAELCSVFECKFEDFKKKLKEIISNEDKNKCSSITNHSIIDNCIFFFYLIFNIFFSVH